jgi:hypothetical protein
VRRKLILVVIDGLTASTFESAVDSVRTPALAFLAEHGAYGRAVSTFPSLTPVCLSSIATGAHPDVHRIPHLVWYHRPEGRIVEYGSSFAALRAAGTRRSISDAIFNMNEKHLGPEAVTVFEALEDAGLTAAAVNITCYRGRTEHRPALPGLTRSAFGPRRFFFYNLFESDVTGAPVAVGGRAVGSIDRYAAAVGRWLVTRDGFDFFAFYLPDYDFASHASGPEDAREALARSDLAVAALMDAAGGPDELLERYAVVVCSDHGQTGVSEIARLQSPFRGVPGVLVTASNRAGMVYRLDEGAPEPAELARGSTGSPRPRWPCTWKGTRRSRAATAPSSASRRPGRAGGPRATLPSSIIRTVSRARGARSRIRMPARCWSRRRPASSSPTSAAVTTPAGGATARCPRGTRSSRCWRSGSTGCRGRSPRSPRPSSRTSASSRLPTGPRLRVRPDTDAAPLAVPLSGRAGCARAPVCAAGPKRVDRP